MDRIAVAATGRRILVSHQRKEFAHGPRKDASTAGALFVGLPSAMTAETSMGTESEHPNHTCRNRAWWDEQSKGYFQSGWERWASDEPIWGIWEIPERELRVLPTVAGKDVLELGCGTAYLSAWLSRRGARVVGLDLSGKQLESACCFQREFGLTFPLIHASAEAVPISDARFDLVLSEYGASVYCDPYLWIPEAARLLRPGGELIFLKPGTLLMLCTPSEEPILADERLARDYFGMHRIEWPDEDCVDFDLPYGEWIRLFRRSGLTVEDLIEVRAPEGEAKDQFHLGTREWARRWPSEEIWKARKPA
jgi:SAM-dependent methyltransferase